MPLRLAMFVLAVAAAFPASGAIYTVTTAAAAGPGSLDAAVTAANGDAAADTIEFAIPGAGVHTITLSAALVITQPLTIDGYSQDGSSPNTMPLSGQDDAVILIAINGFRIEVHATVTIQGLSMHGSQIWIEDGAGSIIRGNFFGVAPDGTTVAPGPGLLIDTPSSATVAGGPAPADRNVFSSAGFVGRGILINRSSMTVEGNFIGLLPDGMTAAPYFAGIDARLSDLTVRGNVIAGMQYGVTTVDCAVVATRNLVGLARDGVTPVPNGRGMHLEHSTGATVVGGAPAERNVISANTVFGLSINSSTADVTVEGNFIGTDITGALDRGNSVGVWVDGSIGAPLRVTGGNVISGNSAEGIRITSTGSSGVVEIAENLIGLAADALSALGNAIGIRGTRAQRTIIGASAPGAGGNTIAHNDNAAIELAGLTTKSYSIFSNSIHQNGGASVELLGVAGPEPIDLCDPDAGPNDLQNMPVLTSASTTTIQGTLEGQAGASYTIEFFASPNPGEARTPIGSTTSTDAACSRSFSGPISVPLPPGTNFITAIATDSSGNSSEVSAVLPIIGVTKGFAPSSVAAGDPATLTITLSNPDPLNAITGVAFTDTFPAGLTTTGAASTTCGGVANAGGGSVSLSGGTIPAGGSCTVTVAVSSGTPGGYTNDIPAGAVTANNAMSNAAAASGTLNVAVQDALVVTKAFSPSTLDSLGTTVLSVSITNPGAAPAIGVSFTDAYPAGLVNAAAPNASSTCGGVVTATPFGSALTLSGGTIAPGATCVVSATVSATTNGSIVNTIDVNAVTSATNASNSEPATATLTVAVVAIPTLEEWALLALAMALAVAGMWSRKIA